MNEWMPIETAPFDKDVLVLDNHEFVYRARRHKTKVVHGWIVYGQRHPVSTTATWPAGCHFPGNTPPHCARQSGR